MLRIDDVTLPCQPLQSMPPCENSKQIDYQVLDNLFSFKQIDYQVLNHLFSFKQIDYQVLDPIYLA